MYIKGHLCDKHMCMIMLMWLCYSFTPIHVCFFVLFPSLPSFPVVHGSLQRNLEITNERTNGRMLLRFQAKLCHVVVCLSVCVSHTLCVQCNERKKVHSSLCLCLCLFVCLSGGPENGHPSVCLSLSGTGQCVRPSAFCLSGNTEHARVHLCLLLVWEYRKMPPLFTCLLSGENIKCLPICLCSSRNGNRLARQACTRNKTGNTRNRFHMPTDVV